MAEFNTITGTNVLITPHAAWALPPIGAKWISFANTGIGPGSFSPSNSTDSPAAIFTEVFSLPFAINSGSVRVWADDTAALYIDGNLALDVTSFAQDGHCHAGPIGCEPLEYADLSLSGLGAGTHILEIAAFQVGSGPFGVLYSGSVESLCETVPEPETVALLGLGILSFGMIRKRKAA